MTDADTFFHAILITCTLAVIFGGMALCMKFGDGGPPA